MTKKQKKVLYRIIAAAVLMAALHFVPVQGYLKGILYLIPYLMIGYDILRKAVLGIVHGEIFDENFLMAVATVGAMLLGEYAEGVAVMLFYQIGELFQSVAVGKSRRNISALMDIRPDYANVEQDGELVTVEPDEVAVGSVIVVRPGEKVPIDGVVVEGSSTLNTGALTGESVPRDIRPGEAVISGCVNVSGLLKIQTTKEFDESTVSKILDLVENSSMKKSRSENFITKFARYYTPIVCYSALALAVLPPIVLLLMGEPARWGVWIFRALSFLVISCPCALVISIPLSFFGGIGGASARGILVKGSNYLEALAKTKYVVLVISCPCALVISIPLSFFGGIGGASARGILVKGSNYLEALAKTKYVVFDKTGTLTKGVFAVTGIYPSEAFLEKYETKEAAQSSLLEYAAYAESYSNHPISKSLKDAYGKEIDGSRVSGIEETGGHGVTAKVNGVEVAAGNARLMKALGLVYTENEGVGTVVHLAVDRVYAGCILISDMVKEQSKEAIAALKAAGVKKTVMLTGDRKEAAVQVAEQLGLDEVRSELLPADKVAAVESLLQNKSEKEVLAFVGDGVNDAPVLSRADVGIAMGALGSDAAIEAADIVLMDDNPMKIALAMRISRKCIRIVYENIFFALTIKGLCLILGAVGIANMWMAIFADVGVMVLAVLNAVRCLRISEK